MMAQQSVTLIQCKIYNWNTHKQPIQFTIYDSNSQLIYSKLYEPTLSNHQISLRLTIKLTFSQADKQIILSLKVIPEDKSEQSEIELVIDFDKLKRRQNFFKTDLDNCIVNIVTEQYRPVQLPIVKLKNKNEEVETFIKQKQEYLQRLKKQFFCIKQRNVSPGQKIYQNSQEDTPYFQKEAQKRIIKIDQSEKIKRLIAQAKQLRKQTIIVSNKSQRLQDLYSTTQPSLSEINIQDKQEKEKIYINQIKQNQMQHYHLNKHFISRSNQPIVRQKSYEYPQTRTNDSYSVYSSRSEYFLDNFNINNSQSHLFDVRFPFKQRFL